MSSENIARNLRALWRAEKIIADIRLRHLLVNLGLKAFAALIAAFGLLMLELAAYFALVHVWTAIVSAAALGAFNFLVAAALLVVAARQPATRELDLANEVHGAAISNLQAEAQGLQSLVGGMLRHPLEGILPSLIVPLVSIAVRSLRKPKVPQPGAAE